MKIIARTILIITLTGCTGSRPTHLGGIQTSLQPCPQSPNCVSSLSKSSDHHIRPFEKSTMEQISAHLSSDQRAKVIFSNDHYIYAEYTTGLLRFIDDVEFLKSPTEEMIHVRSASRIGYSDMGKNRDRIEEIRTSLTH